MYVVALLAQKGGVGKTTLAVTLAVTAEQDRQRSGVVDADPQATASGWFQARQARGVQTPVVASAADPKTLRQAVQDARDDAFDVLFLDTPAGVSELPVAAASLADLVLVPCVPSTFNLDAMGPTVLLLKRAKVPAFFVVNRGRSTGINNECALALSSAYGLPAVNVHIANRLPIGDAERTGSALTELTGKHPSIVNGKREFKALWAWVQKQRKAVK